MDNILDHVVVQGQRYDIVSPTAFGDYIETIGSACINPDGYAQGSTFLARLGNEQFYYEATAAITQGSTISEGTNCKKTTVTGREAELAEYVDSLNEALSNEVSTFAESGAVNLSPNNASTTITDGVTFTVNSDRSVTASNNAATGNIKFVIGKTTLKANKTYRINDLSNGTPNISEDGNFGVLVRKVSGLIWVMNTADTPVPAVYTPTEDTEVEISIYINSGANANRTFYPMLCLDSYKGPYQPYAMTNMELTENVTYKSQNLQTYLNVSKIGKHICNLGRFFSTTSASITANAWLDTGLTVDSEYRPSLVDAVGVANVLDGYSSHIAIGLVSVSTSGKVKVLSPVQAGTANQSFQFDFTYFV